MHISPVTAKRILLLAITATLSSCQSGAGREKDSVLPSNTSSTEAAANVSYSLVSIELNNKRAFNASVRIPGKLPDAQLLTIAQQAKSELRATSDKGVIFFLLPEMVDKTGAWSAVDFLPEMTVRLIGRSMADDESTNAQLPSIKDYVGLWADNGSLGNVIIRIRKDKHQGYVLEYIDPAHPAPSTLATPLIRTTHQGKTIYQDTEHPDQHFLVEDNGNLSVYDEDGFVTTYQKLK